MKNHLIFLFIYLFHGNIFGQLNNYNTSSGQRDVINPNSSILKTGFVSSDSSGFSISKSSKNNLSRFNNRFLIQHKDSELFLGLNPILNLSSGNGDSTGQACFQNTRGIYLFGKTERFKFVSILCENQVRLPEYEKAFISSHGEYYPITSGYNQQNGVISGGIRTKPFKNGGYDYFFSRSIFEYQVNKKIKIIAGNAPLFIGSGYRSLILSDVTSFPMILSNIAINKHFSVSVLRGRMFDLVRKPYYTGVESSYLTKAFSQHSLEFKYNKMILGLFYQNIWNMGDSLQHKRVSPLYWIPVPGLDCLKDANASAPMLGLSLEINVAKTVRLYGQLISRGEKKGAQGGQLGIIGSTTILHGLFKIIYRGEFNHSGPSLYGEQGINTFTHSNMPIGSLLGNGIQEGLIRFSIIYKNWSCSTNWHYYNQGPAESILFQKQNYSPLFDEINQLQVEFGYSIHQHTKTMAFIGLNSRMVASNTSVVYWQIGIKSKIFEEYHDY